ncbi:DUF2391 domain-containing protein [Rubrivirga sp.]|uniref:DUF2391 domain-containing protein n=1 Tax=Rubrivirga sp. TaxID=1885344 RepID=UPI003C73318A
MSDAPILVPDAGLEVVDPVAAPAHVPAVVLGWVEAGAFDEAQRAAFKKARAMVRSALRAELPGFAWSFPYVRRRDLGVGVLAVEPVDLLDAGVTERRLAGWDFAFVVTASDLHARFRPFTLATPSQALDTAALSIARLDPAVRDTDMTDEERTERLAHRIAALALHSFGHLNGLDHETRPEAVMYPPKAPSDLDASSLAFTSENQIEIRQEVADVADPRMEEESIFETLSAPAFALKAVVLNWADIADTVLQIRPWRFPFQLSKLTTAAFSTLVVLVMTAEAWDLGTRQPWWLIIALSAVAIVGTSGYLVRKQGLLARRHGHARTEQQVVQAVSILLALALGMLTTYGLLFGTTLVLRTLFFDPAILDGWSASLGRPVGPDEVLVFAGFVAALGLGVGALGGSFEDQTYFRHVAYVDEET